MRTAKTTPSRAGQSAVVSSGGLERAGIVAVTLFCIGERIAWSPENYREHLSISLLPNARFTYQRIQVFLI
ncbi:MAG: hypothetical protein ABI443_13510 [Chthoniobacterales bacterium]